MVLTEIIGKPLRLGTDAPNSSRFATAQKRRKLTRKTRINLYEGSYTQSFRVTPFVVFEESQEHTSHSVSVPFPPRSKQPLEGTISVSVLFAGGGGGNLLLVGFTVTPKEHRPPGVPNFDAGPFLCRLGKRTVGNSFQISLGSCRFSLFRPQMDNKIRSMFSWFSP